MSVNDEVKMPTPAEIDEAVARLISIRLSPYVPDSLKDDLAIVTRAAVAWAYAMRQIPGEEPKVDEPEAAVSRH